MIVACKKKEPEKTPAPPQPAVADAAVAAEPIDASAPDAPAAKLVLTREGLGPLQGVDWSKHDGDGTVKVIQDALAPLMPGITTAFDVMDVPGEVEHEEGYLSVKRGEKELVMVLSDTVPTILVWTPEIPTDEGIKVGDTVATVLAKHPNLHCANDPGALIAEMVAADIKCDDKDAPGMLYVLDPNKKKLKRGELKPSSVADVPIAAIVAIPK